MKKLFLLLILSFFSAQSFAGSCPDGSEPVKSISADGTYFVFNCGGGNEQASSSTNSNIKPLAGIDIENDPNNDFFKPPPKPNPTDKLYWWVGMWQMVDFNKDGYSDVLYIGVMNPNNVELTGEDTGGICGGGACKGGKPLPSLYLGDANKQLTYSPELIIDNREDSGISLGMASLVADYNNDGILDFYVADHGVGTHDGVRDSYFLSQSNGTWVESSETHLSHSNFVVFDHGGATGDIDNDGDMDVVITELNGKTGTALWCLVNDGTGYLNKRKCGGIFSFALELADIDGDGYLDVLLGAHEFDNNSFTGIVWNDGSGNFPKHSKTSLPQHKKKWGTVPEVSASDLDNDGDLDIVYSRAGKLYVGTAVQIIENLGNKKFKDHGIFPLVEAPTDFIPTHEGNEWNDGIDTIKFRDLDEDGDIDLYLSSGGSPKTNGTVLLNNGNFNFDLIRPDEALTLFRDGTDSKIIIGHKKHIPTDEEQAVLDEIAELEAELEAEAAIIAVQEQKALDELAELEAELEAELAEENKSSPLFDGRYSFNLLRYHDEEDWQELGSGFVEIKNGEIMIDKDNSDLKTGSTELYDTFSGQINKKGKISASTELDILGGGVDRSEVYNLSGQIDEKVWGDSPREDFFRVYMRLEVVDTIVSSPLFDGRYSFNLLRYHDEEDWQELGSGYIEINNGIMTIAKEGRILDTGSIDLYDSFAGQINKKGNIISSLKISALFGVDSTPLVDLNGSVDNQLQGKWDNYFDVILKFGKKE